MKDFKVWVQTQWKGGGGGNGDHMRNMYAPNNYVLNSVKFEGVGFKWDVGYGTLYLMPIMKMNCSE